MTTTEIVMIIMAVHHDYDGCIMIMMDVWIMIDDDYRNRDDHYGSASSAVKSSSHRLLVIIHHIIRNNARFTQKPLQFLALYI